MVVTLPHVGCLALAEAPGPDPENPVVAIPQRGNDPDSGENCQDYPSRDNGAGIPRLGLDQIVVGESRREMGAINVPDQPSEAALFVANSWQTDVPILLFTALCSTIWGRWREGFYS